MRTDAFDYDLPASYIAQRPATPRDASRLMVLDRSREGVEHRRFRDLPGYLRAGDVLVVNDSRVLPARLFGRKEGTGGGVEVLLLERLSLDTWEALVRPGRRLSPGTRLDFGGGLLRAEVAARTPAGGRVLRFSWDGGPFEAVLHRLGEIPLPPYIKEKLDDPERYQTVYAREEGSKAAPTAGLHFTPRLLDEVRARGVAVVGITLHVGLGTFRPVTSERVEDHRMHPEYYRIPPEAARAVRSAKEEGRRVIAVGTTAVRTLEAAADERGGVAPGEGRTEIFIYPGYRFKVVDAMITNFHLPRSSLLMLVAAFAGRERILAAYEEAKREGYRFYSFGDAMLIV